MRGRIGETRLSYSLMGLRFRVKSGGRKGERQVLALGDLSSNGEAPAAVLCVRRALNHMSIARRCREPACKMHDPMSWENSPAQAGLWGSETSLRRKSPLSGRSILHGRHSDIAGILTRSTSTRAGAKGFAISVAGGSATFQHRVNHYGGFWAKATWCTAQCCSSQFADNGAA